MAVALALFLIFALPSATDQALPRSHQAYVWQRVWTGSVRRAIGDAADLFDGWRVLVASSEVGGRLRVTSVDWSALRDSGKPVIAVIRIDGSLSPPLEAEFLTRIAALISSIETAADLRGLEIDYDCPTFRLPAYAGFLEGLRAVLPANLSLSITVLPTWMGSRDLGAVLAQANEATLQVHAVESPRRGLFDADQALVWTRRFSTYRHPFRIALPAYGVRVSWRKDGSPLVESERPLLASAGTPQTLVVDPAEVARFLDRLTSIVSPDLLGITWFRLPLDSDQRAWTRSTLRGVVRGERMSSRITIAYVPNARGYREIVLRNAGPVDAILPPRVAIQASCKIGDGIGGYRWTAGPGGGAGLENDEGGLLRAGAARVIGWARCTEAGTAHGT